MYWVFWYSHENLFNKKQYFERLLGIEINFNVRNKSLLDYKLYIFYIKSLKSLIITSNDIKICSSY